MYCKNCGFKNADDAKFCVSCGERLEQKSINANKVENYFQSFENQNNDTASTNSDEQQRLKEKKMCGMAIAGFIVSIAGFFVAGLICGILGLIFSAMAMKKIKADSSLTGYGFAVAGLAISIIVIVIMFYSLIILGQMSLLM